MANKYPLVSNSTSLTIQELPAGDTLLVDNLAVTGEGNIVGNLTVGGNVTVSGSINANLGNVTVENLVVEGQSDLGAVGNLTITGGDANYVLRTDGTGNLSWANIQSEIANPGGVNTAVQFNDEGVFGGSPGFTYNKNTFSLVVANTIATSFVTTGSANIANVLHAGNVHVNDLHAYHGAYLGNVSDVSIMGGSDGYVLATNGSGVLSWVGIDPSVSGDGGNATSSVLLLASLNGGNAISA